jgi:pSer/pThr/pTyr-binding forkhead associated (FHA) protein
MDVRLRSTAGKSAGREIKIPTDKFLIGRAEDCHLQPKSDLISRHHCVLTISESEVAVRDFGSRNGTIVNGTKVRGEQLLKSGDTLQVGPLEFEVIIQVDTAAKKRPRISSIKEAAARTAADAAGGEMDLDLSDLIGEPDEDQSTAETREITASDTQTIELNAAMLSGDDSATTSEEATAAKDPASEAGTEKAPKKLPGKLPPSKPDSADSSDAASAALRRLYQRR